MFDARNQPEFKTMFREYDIRGEVSDEQLNPESVFLICYAYAEYLNRRGIRNVVVGYDNRDCSPSFAEACIDALLRQGKNVKFFGMGVTPMAYFAQYYLRCEGAVMITASHNPNGWSGFKLAKGYSKTLESEDIRELYQIVTELTEFKEEKTGTLETINIRDAYLDDIVSRIRMGEHRPRIVIDAGNGGAGLVAYELFHRLGCLTFQLYCEPDVTYPHYFPNPSNLEERNRLREIMMHPYVHADIGIAYDGDGDRIGVIDEKGRDIWSDLILALLSRQLLEKKKAATVVYDVKCSKALEEVVSAAGGTPVMYKTGHSYIKSKMHELQAQLAGERSGHIFVGGEDYYGFDDALYVSAKLVEYLSHQTLSLSELIDGFPHYVTSPEIKASCSDLDKYDVVERVTKDLQSRFEHVNTICGARVTFEHGWGLIRASSNLPELVIIFEADTEEHLLEIREELKNTLANYPEVDPHWENDIYDAG